MKHVQEESGLPSWARVVLEWLISKEVLNFEPLFEVSFFLPLLKFLVSFFCCFLYFLYSWPSLWGFSSNSWCSIYYYYYYWLSCYCSMHSWPSLWGFSSNFCCCILYYYYYSWLSCYCSICSRSPYALTQLIALLERCNEGDCYLYSDLSCLF